MAASGKKTGLTARLVPAGDMVASGAESGPVFREQFLRLRRIGILAGRGVSMGRPDCKKILKKDGPQIRIPENKPPYTGHGGNMPVPLCGFCGIDGIFMGFRADVRRQHPA